MAASSHAASTSPALTQTVNGSTIISTTTSLTAAPNPSAFGQTVAFTATVSPSSGTGTPTGGVTFIDGSTVLGSSTLASNGVATFLIANMSVGTHSITAQYSGDSAFCDRTSYSFETVFDSGG